MDRNFCHFIERDFLRNFENLNLKIQVDENFENIQEINDNERICIIEGELKNV